MKRKHIYLIISVLLITFVFLSFAKTKDTASIDVEVIPIGLSTVLTGDFAGLGENLVKSVDLIIPIINQKYAEQGLQFEIIVENSGWTSKEGLSAAQKLVSADKVNYIIGGTNSNGTVATASFVNTEHVLYLTPLTGGESVDEAGLYVFRTAHADVLVGESMVAEMKWQELETVGLVYEKSEYSLDIVNYLKSELTAAGIDTLFDFAFQPYEVEFRTLATKSHQYDVDSIIVISNSGVPSGIFIQDYFDQQTPGTKSPTFFTDFVFATNPTALATVENVQHKNIYYADPSYDVSNVETKAFLNEFKDVYGEDPIIPFHALSVYDTLMFLTDAISKEGDNPEKVRDSILENVKDYEGLVGIYSLDENGNSDLGFTMRKLE